MFAKKLLFTVVAMGLLAAAGPAQAANNYFLNGGDYGTAGNWSLGWVPKFGGTTTATMETAIIANGLTATLSSDVTASVPDQVDIGNGPNTNSPTDLASTGELDLSDGAVLKIGGQLHIGYGGTLTSLAPGSGSGGVLTMSSAGGVAPSITTTNGNVYIGNNAAGSFTMNAGTLNTGTGYLMVGYQVGSVGSLFTINGGTVKAGNLYPGYNSQSKFVMTGGLVALNGTIYEGNSDAGSFYQSGGA